MKVLLDVGIAPRLRSVLSEALDGAVVESAVFHDWRTLQNGELLRRAQQRGFTTLVTADKRLAQEQAPLPIAVVAVDDNQRSALLRAVRQIVLAVRGTPAGHHELVAIRASTTLTPQRD